MDNLYFYNFLPNIWISYINSASNTNNTNDYVNILKQFSKLHNIKQIIRLDTDIIYWLNSRNYNNAIKNTILKNEMQKLINYYNETIKLIYQNYFNNVATLIISNKNLEILIGLLYCYLNKYSDMTGNNILSALQSIFNIHIKISHEMKLLLNFIKY